MPGSVTTVTRLTVILPAGVTLASAMQANLVVS